MQWPEDLYTLTKEADYCHLPNGKKQWYTRNSLNQSFLNWFVFISRPDGVLFDNDQTSINLKSKLTNYFDTHRDQMKENPHFADLTSFFKYVAATITRTYKLGCLLLHDVFLAFQEYVRSGNKDFIELFSKILPQWHFTETDMDVVNIIWQIGNPRKNNGEADSTNGYALRVGYRLKERYQQYGDSIIPISSDCPTAPYPTKKIDDY